MIVFRWMCALISPPLLCGYVWALGQESTANPWSCPKVHSFHTTFTTALTRSCGTCLRTRWGLIGWPATLICVFGLTHLAKIGLIRTDLHTQKWAGTLTAKFETVQWSLTFGLWWWRLAHRVSDLWFTVDSRGSMFAKERVGAVIVPGCLSLADYQTF